MAGKTLRERALDRLRRKTDWDPPGGYTEAMIDAEIEVIRAEQAAKQADSDAKMSEKPAKKASKKVAETLKAAKLKEKKDERTPKAAKTKGREVAPKPKKVEPQPVQATVAEPPKAAPAPVVEPPKAAPVVAKAAGRPRKHTSGGQVSIWLTDELRKALKIKAIEHDKTFSDLISEILADGIKKY